MLLDEHADLGARRLPAVPQGKDGADLRKGEDHGADCSRLPQHSLVRDRITAALDGRQADVELIEVREEAEAAGWGVTGSPTVLVDGVDPFAVKVRRAG